MLQILMIIVLLLTPFSHAKEYPWTAKELASPKELSERIIKKDSALPLILHVGFEAQYTGNHIPGSKYLGLASSPQGMKNIKA